MHVNIDPSWQKELSTEFEALYFKELVSFVKHEYSTYHVYPPGRQIFAAFDHTSFDDVKVVIIGQDPYHGEGQAHGLCFSVNDGVKFPPSLVNIFKELKSDLDIEMPSSGNLQRWAKQGVLLLNATLTVRANTAGSHQNKGWELFTDAVIRVINEKKDHVVFILWGAYAQKKGALIDRQRHFIVSSSHPSPFSVHNGFFGSKPFSKTNEYLVSKGKVAIEW